MIAIAGGIILAVLFFMFLGEILVISAGLIGIGLLIGAVIGIYLLFDNISLTAVNKQLIVVGALVIGAIAIAFKNKNVVNKFYIPWNKSSEEKSYVMSVLLKTDGINSVISNGFNEITVNFNTDVISKEVIKMVIDASISSESTSYFWK